MRMPQGAEWLIILLLVVLLFGAKRLPDAARGVGRSLRIFKAETKGMADDAAATAPEVPGPAPIAAPVTPAEPAAAAAPPAVAAPPAAPQPAAAQPAPSQPAAAQPVAQPDRAEG
jgi:sec-independent protein translocase protein TatA